MVKELNGRFSFVMGVSFEPLYNEICLDFVNEKQDKITVFRSPKTIEGVERVKAYLKGFENCLKLQRETGFTEYS